MKDGPGKKPEEKKGFFGRALDKVKDTAKGAELLVRKQLIETGRYRAVIDRRYPLEAVVEATTYVETKQKTGNVVLTINGSRTR